MERGLRRKTSIIDDVIIEDRFCYWQEVPPIIHPIYNNNICLLKENEYRLAKELGTEYKQNIFCNYKNAEQAMKCEQYCLIKDMKWDKS